MSQKERAAYNLIIAWAVLSISTGLIMRFAPPVELPPPTFYDRLYFFMAQLCELVLIYVVYVSHSNEKIRTLIQTLLILSVAEMYDEVIGNNIKITINDYGLLAAAIFYLAKRIKSHGRPEK